MIRTDNKHIGIISGDNLSGRSHFLKNISDYFNNREIDKDKNIYVGPIPNSSISGLVPTVREEFVLCNYQNSIYHSNLSKLIEELGFLKLMDRNPFTLSGGEQAILAILTAISLESDIVTIDCIFEQLHHTVKQSILNFLLKNVFVSNVIFIADNRLKEYGNFYTMKVPPNFPEEKFVKPLLLKNLNSDTFNTFHKSSKGSVLSLKDIGFSYKKGIPVLKNITIDLEPGTLYHLSGINGAGKSTLAKLLCGVLKPDRGEIFLGHKKYHAFSHPGLHIGYHFQNPDEQLFCNTIEKELFPIPKKKIDDSKQFTTFKNSLVKTFGLENILQEHPSEMPFVIRKRIALAASLSMERSWLILDEPTLGQDDKNVWHIIEIINKLLKNGVGIILISHSDWFNEILPIKTIKLHNGLIHY